MKLLIILFIFPIFIIAFDGIIQLHVNDFNSFYRGITKNKILKKLQRTRNWSTFKYSKLYLRLSDDIKKLDSKYKVLNLKNIGELPKSPADFYLMDIEFESFIAKINLEKSQSAKLINIDFNKLNKISFHNKEIYKYNKILIVLEDNYLYISNNLKYFKLYLKNTDSFNSKVKKNNKYKNYIYINLNKIKKTPYLKNYWFTMAKDFSNLDTTIIYFNLNDNYIEESGSINIKKKNLYEGFKVIEGNFKINLFNINGNFQIAPFINRKEFKIYSMVTNDFISKLYLAKYNGNKDFKTYLKSLSPSAKLVDSKMIEYHYGLLNREKMYFKVINKDILFSNDLSLLNNVILKDSNGLYQKIIILDSKNMFKELVKLSKLDSNNYSYNKFVNTYLKNYMTVKSFTFKITVKGSDNLFFKTKIIF